MRTAMDFARGQFRAVIMVPEQGFTIVDEIPVDGDPFPGPWLVAQGDPRRFPEITAPLANKSLHRKFVRLRGQDEIAAFANRWGFLGHGVVPGAELRAEPVCYWESEIERLGEVVELADTVQEARTGSWRARDELERRVVWDDHGAVQVTWPHTTGVFATSRSIYMGRHQRLTERSKIALDAIMEAVQEKFDGGTWAGCNCQVCLVIGDVTRVHAPFLEFAGVDSLEAASLRREARSARREAMAARQKDLEDVYYHPYVHPRLAASVTPNGITLVPQGLLVALYSLFALELVYGNASPSRTCVVCGGLFTPLRRRDAQTCSPACRQAKSRHPERYR